MSLDPLHLSVMNTFWEIKENLATEKTDMEFYSFDHIIIPLFFWYIDLIYQIPMENVKQITKNYHIS